MGKGFGLAVALLLAQGGWAAESGQAEFKGCYAKWSATELVIGNTHIERAWKIFNGLLTATSFRDKDANCEWLAKPAARPAPSPNENLPKETRPITIAAQTGRANPVSAEALTITLTAPGRASFAHQLQIFPAARGIGISFSATGELGSATAAKKTAATTATGIEGAGDDKSAPDSGDALEIFNLAPPHLRFVQATLMDQTDNHNELAFETEWLLMPNEAPLKLAGNVFAIENPLTGAGLVFLKQAPLPHARPVKTGADAVATPSKREVRFAGQGYPFVVLAYGGGEFGRIAALQSWQRQLRRFEPARDGLFLSNTWGDRSRDARINEEFILKEVAAGAQLGVDIVQVDDGWQKGRTANSAAARGKGVWNGYWAADPNFWQPDAQRFPRGLAPVVQAARVSNMKFGLWFGPDSSDGMANWQRDADRLVELHDKDGIDYFKIDSVKATTPATEQNLRNFFDSVLQRSGGKVVFDLDVTAEIRPGYFGMPHVGPLFVENRYTDFHRYWPHQTLRNLWKLAHYVDPLRLRMELLNNRRNDSKYTDDPLAPARYRADALFAVTMFANPLGWFEVSNLPEDYVSELKPLVAVWKRERAQMLGGTLLPIGAAPDGFAWTGFASVAADQRSGYLLLFRENNARADWRTELPLFATGKYRLTPLAGEGTAKLQGNILTAQIPAPLRYLWLRVERTGD
ncbi:MAG: alpha-galactosidase [Kiritimatiellaeota bacterium]|nr:alpha-galactosidase [Kiritimatiellota bacterium]